MVRISAKPIYVFQALVQLCTTKCECQKTSLPISRRTSVRFGTDSAMTPFCKKLARNPDDDGYEQAKVLEGIYSRCEAHLDVTRCEFGRASLVRGNLPGGHFNWRGSPRSWKSPNAN